MRRSETLSAAIATSFDRAWDFLSRAENLHLWTVDFAVEQPRKEGDIYKVETPRGTLDLFIKCQRETGVIDFYFGREGRYGCSPSRLIVDDEGVVYIFTQFEPVGAAPGVLERLVGNVKKEFEILKQLLTTPEPRQELL
jgi:hypothetical protein